MPSYKLTSIQATAIKNAIDALRDDAEMRDDLKHVKPLVRKDGILYEIEMPDLFNEAFNWDPKFIRSVDMNKLDLVSAKHTYHTCGYHALLKPSVAEVLVQMPLGQNVDAFECILHDGAVEIITEDFWYGHKLTTLFYRTKP